MTQSQYDEALVQTSATASLQKAPHVIPSSLQINHIRSNVRPGSEKAGMLSWFEEKGHADRGDTWRVPKDICPAAQDKGMC